VADDSNKIRAMGIVDELLASSGLYIGTDHVLDADRVGAARIAIAPWPGHAGVTLDYEILNPSSPDRLYGHAEHTMIGRTHEGPSVMVISDKHASSLAILQEADSGVFELGGRPAVYPMKVGSRSQSLAVCITSGGLALPEKKRSSELSLT
jgi:hypothetical protein